MSKIYTSGGTRAILGNCVGIFMEGGKDQYTASGSGACLGVRKDVLRTSGCQTRCKWQRR